MRFCCPSTVVGRFAYNNNLKVKKRKERYMYRLPTWVVILFLRWKHTTTLYLGREAVLRDDEVNVMKVLAVFDLPLHG
jgi:type VI protein secretion system component VasF